MVLNSIVFFLSLAASFFLFFFNVPYWTGEDMADMSESGIWRACFRVLSTIGFGCFMLYKTIVNKLLSMFFSRVHGLGSESARLSVADLVDVLCSAGVLFLLISGHSRLMDSLFPAGVDALAEGNDGTLLGKLSEAVVFLRVTADFKAENGGGFIMAAKDTVLAAIQYVAVNTLFFSVLFGFLQNLLVKVPFFDLLSQRLNYNPAAMQEEEEASEQSLLGQLKKAVVDFFNKMTVHMFAYNPVSLTLFLLVLLIYSFVMTWLGKNNLGPLDVVRQVLDAIGVVQIVASFFVTWLAAKLSEKAANAVVDILPQGMQDAIHDTSRKWNEWVAREDDKRRDWAESCRYDFNFGFKNDTKHDYNPSKKLDLFGSDKHQ